AVADGQGAQVVLVAKAAAGRAGEVIGDGAVGEGDGAVAGVAEGPGQAVEGRVAGDHDAVHGQVGAVVVIDVEADGGSLVDAGVAAEHAAGVDEHVALADGVDAAAGVAGLVVADRAVVDRQRPGGVDLVVDRDAGAGAGADVIGEDHVGQSQVGV